MIGILPTLRKDHLTPELMTDAPRYRALSRGLRRMRHDPFDIQISGADPLHIVSNDIGLEGANTSFQVHLRVSPRDFLQRRAAGHGAVPCRVRQFAYFSGPPAVGRSPDLALQAVS